MIRASFIVSLALAACVDSPPLPVVGEVVPAQWEAGNRQSISISGEGFFVRVVTDFTEPSGNRVRDGLEAHLVGTATTWALEEVRRVDAATLAATAPSDVEPGTYELEITDAWSRVVTATTTIEVTPPPVVQCPECWWSDDYRGRVQLDIDFSNGVDDLVDFPVLVTLHSSRIDYALAAADGSDLRFVDPDSGAEMSHEVERWNPTQISHVWVRIPRLVAGEVKTLHAYYGNPTPGDPPIESVWDDHYAGVWHMGDDPDVVDFDVLDSSPTLSHGIGIDFSAGGRDSGKVGYGLRFDGQAAHVRVPSGLAPDPLAIDGDITLECWTRRAPPDPTTWAVLIGRQWDDGFEDSYVLAVHRDDPTRGVAVLSPGTTVIAGDSGALPTGSWHHIAGIRRGDTVSLYIDGELDEEQSGLPSIEIDDNDITFGGEENNPSDQVNEFYRGMIDEVRISNIARSPEWMREQHRSMSDLMITYGAPELL